MILALMWKSSLTPFSSQRSLLLIRVTQLDSSVPHYKQTYSIRGVCEPALKPTLCREGCLGKCHSRQPDSGNPTVRDETGGLGKRGLWWKCEPTSQPKGREW